MISRAGRPAAAECLVALDEGARPGGAGSGQAGFGVEERALSIEDGEDVDDAGLVALLGRSWKTGKIS
jgi:hypothetical protein